MRIALFIALLAMACVAACHTTSPPSEVTGPMARHEPLATLERTPCFGFCPVYKVTIFRDGVVEYEVDLFFSEV